MRTLPTLKSAVLSYPQCIRSQTLSGRLKPQIIPNPIYTLQILCVFLHMHTYNKGEFINQPQQDYEQQDHHNMLQHKLCEWGLSKYPLVLSSFLWWCARMHTSVTRKRGEWHGDCDTALGFMDLLMRRVTCPQAPAYGKRRSDKQGGFRTDCRQGHVQHGEAGHREESHPPRTAEISSRYSEELLISEKCPFGIFRPWLAIGNWDRRKQNRGSGWTTGPEKPNAGDKKKAGSLWNERELWRARKRGLRGNLTSIYVCFSDMTAAQKVFYEPPSQPVYKACKKMNTVFHFINQSESNFKTGGKKGGFPTWIYSSFTHLDAVLSHFLKKYIF